MLPKKGKMTPPSAPLRISLRISLPLMLSTCAAVACGGPPESARVAQGYLARGNYPRADSAAKESIALHPRDPTSWRVLIRSDLAQGKLALGTEHYRQWKERHGGHDAKTYHLMAVATLWQGMQVPAPQMVARSITIIERHEIEKLADEVRNALANDSDLVAGTAAIALLRSFPTAPDLATQLLNSESAKVRAMVVLGIGSKIGSIARGDLVPALGDADPRVRRAAVSAIGGWHDQKDAARIGQMARLDVDGQVRSRALRMLLPSARDQDLPLALASLHDAYIGARLAGLALLEKLSPVEAKRRAVPLSRNPQDLPLALAALALLHKSEKVESDDILRTAMASQNLNQRASALNRAAQVLTKAGAISLATKGATDIAVGVRIAAARLLLRLGERERGASILTRELTAPSITAQRLAATELARLGNVRAREILASLCQLGTAEQREQAIAAHAALGLMSDGLITALGDDNIRVRLAAADALLYF